MRRAILLFPFALVWAIPTSAGIIQVVQASFATGSDARAIQELSAYRASQGITPEYLEAFSWLARAEFQSGNYLPAEKFSQAIYTFSVVAVSLKPKNKETHLPTA